MRDFYRRLIGWVAAAGRTRWGRVAGRALWLSACGLAVAAGVLVVRMVAFGPVTMHGFTPEERAVIERAVERLEKNGFTLPQTHVMPDRSPAHCVYKGTARESWPVRLIKLCDVEEHIVVHELAHVWTYNHLDWDDREAWARRRGLDTWNGKDVRWGDRAAEQAAEILTWYLYFGEAAHTSRRISGPVGLDVFERDVEWLLAAGGDPATWDTFDERIDYITAAYRHSEMRQLVEETTRMRAALAHTQNEGVHPRNARRYAQAGDRSGVRRYFEEIGAAAAYGPEPPEGANPTITPVWVPAWAETWPTSTTRPHPN